MLDGCGDDMTLSRLRSQGAMNCRVVALGAAASKNKLPWIGVEKGGQFLAGLFDMSGDLFAERVSAGRISPQIADKRQHRFDHLGGNPSGSVIVQVTKLSLTHGREKI